jgi:1-acyl-sn-glycerol-3-phosphate acyltransferase
MNVLAVISPGLKVLFERVGKPDVINRPDVFRFGRTGAVIACNHVGWADSLPAFAERISCLSCLRSAGPVSSVCG